jgi:hypothetical protein
MLVLSKEGGSCSKGGIYLARLAYSGSKTRQDSDSDLPICCSLRSNFHPMWRFESVLARVPSVHWGCYAVLGNLASWRVL